MGLRGLLGSEEAEEHSESRGEWNENSFPAWNSEEDALNVARTDARQSLDQTIHTIRDIDETAMSTLRIDLIIIGLVLTAVTSVPATLRLGNVVSILGFVSILGSALLALVTNIGSNYPTGVSADYLREFRASSWSEREWNEWMIREYESWLADASQMADGDARALFYTQLTLALGIVLLVAGILLGVTGRPPMDPLVEVGNRSVRATGSTFYVGPQYVRV
ncbi:hypothetical protein [Halosimplex halobium]|uniref:hypothetical protein n=1 Tax=Halosimplex halobium TaxID=3396618 RepID=UPI003F55328B